MSAGVDRATTAGVQPGLPPPAVSTRALVVAAVAVGGGVYLGHGRPSIALWLAILAALATAAAAACTARPAKSRAVVNSALAAAVVACILAAGANAGWRAAAADSRLLPRLSARGLVVEVCGVVVEAQAASALLDVRRVTFGQRRWRVHEPVRVAPGRGGAALRVRSGDGICAVGEVRARMHPPKHLREAPPLFIAKRVREYGRGSLLRTAAGVIRTRFARSALAALPRREAGLLLGMTDGETTYLDDNTVEAFRATGMAHLVAVSGSNVAIVIAVMAMLVRVLVPRGRWLRALLIGGAMTFFAVLTNLEPSVLRAVVSASVLLAATAGGRTAEGLRACALAFIALAIAVPDIVLDVGFQLSFGATLGLIAWAEPASAWFTARFGGGRGASAIGAACGTTLAAQFAVAPLLALRIGRIPALGGVANLVGVPLAPLITIGGLVTLGAASVWSGLGWAPAMLRVPLLAILRVAEVFSKLPAASVNVDVAAAMAIACAFGWLVWRGRTAGTVLLAMAVLSSGVAVGMGVVRRTHGCGRSEQVQALDIGQGSAVLVRDGNHAVLLDAAPAKAGVVRQLRSAGVRRLDAVVLTHPHADHTLGLLEIINAMPVEVVLGPVTMRWGTGKRVMEAVTRRQIDIQEVAAGDRAKVGAMTIEVLAPEPGPAPEMERSELIDSYSLIVRVITPTLRVLAPGDVDLPAQVLAAESGGELASDVLIAVHHGSASVDTGFVEAVAPRLTVISVGAGNTYGHPTRRALDIYRRHGPVWRTDRHGRVVVCRVDGRMVASTAR